MNDIAAPFQITEQEIERTSLEPDDFGRWALLIQGCFHLFDSFEAAKQTQTLLNQQETNL